ncbi:MAG: hypothetical protein U1D70_11085 [Methylobacter sp.]|nr:hypothetical protein [Methylobacter sp.]MDP2427003.1 hypothetical protein [Methylobacter sp.]MDP3054299.1 hypothetical protein [Methylobacter sp.]MDP3363006.1 hypothetical protein [Methylobacter sp.]MDZ4219550.1 hypothetical protein [Methylobacter sp.]
MIGFILCSLSLAALVQYPSLFLQLLATPAALAIGLAIMAASLLAGYFKKISTVTWHDGFATGCLLIWYAHWQPQFNDDAPMFFFFPLYYAMLTSIVTLTLINKSEYFDQESVMHLRYLEKNIRFNIFTVVALVLLSLLITRHYALYPIAMTLFIVRHTLTVCLEIIDS